MKSLKQSAQDYIRMRRLLGFKMRHEERRLRRFVAMEPADAQPATWAERLMCVRVFARYCSGADPRTEVPPLGILPFRAQRATPYIYSEQQIRRLMEAARGLAPSGGLRGLTYRCLFGLLTVTGLRISEALALTRDDVDLRNGLLTIRGAKFGKTRLVPLHASACRALARYAQQRDALLNPPSVANFLLCASGRPPEVSTVRRVFYQLSRQIGLRGRLDSRGPRLQDFRHRCATEILLKWYQAGEDVERRLPVLSTFLGHGHVSDTFWYLSGTSELLQQAARRLEKRWEVQP